MIADVWHFWNAVFATLALLALGACAERRAYPCPGAGSMKDTFEITVAVPAGAGRAVTQLEIVCEAPALAPSEVKP